MGITFSPNAEKEFTKIVQSYPTKHAALLPALWLAQKEFTYISDEVMQLLGERLGLTPAEVYSTATFYTMFNKKPVGKYHVQVCTNVSCMLRGAQEILKTVSEKLGIKVNQSTEDGLFTLSEVECLASCGTAPMCQINEDYYENLTPESVVSIVEKLIEKNK